MTLKNKIKKFRMCLQYALNGQSHRAQYVLLLLFMILPGTGTRAQSTYEEKLLYSTDFQDWENVNTSNSETEVKTNNSNVPIKTTDGQALSFFLTNTSVDNSAKQEDKRGWDYTNLVTIGWMRAGKTVQAQVRTSKLKHVSKVTFVQASTSTPSGWGLKVIGDKGEEIISSTALKQKTGEKITIDVNRNNVQLVFYNITDKNYCFMTSLEIYGNVEVKTNYTVTYYDTDGTTSLGSESITANSNLKYNTEYTNQVKQNVPSGSAFRGWFNETGPSAEKVAEGTTVDMDLNLYAKVTPIETATDGSEYTYNLTKNNFYQEDHELIEINGGQYHNDGWLFENEGTILLQVAKNAHIEMTTSTGTTTRDYTAGVPTTLTLDIPAGTVVKNLQVKNYIPVYVSFDLKNNQGQCPEQILCEPLTGKATLPSNNLIYREGYTFTGWTDANETKIYQAGEEVVFTESTTLHPKMVQNTIDITDTNTPLAVSWDFDHTKAPALSSGKWSSKTIPYTHTVTIENEKRDITLMMDVTTSGAKIENTDSDINGFPGEGGQFNNGTQFSLPAVYGMTLTINASTKVDSRFNISTNFGTADDDAKVTVSDGTNNIDGVISQDKKSITFTYNGDAKNINIHIVQAGIKDKTWGFFKNISVTYPVLPNIVLSKTISNVDKDKFPNEKTENAGTVEITKKTVEGNIGNRYKVGDVVTISATPDYGYDFQEFKIGETTKATSFDYTVKDGINNIEAIFLRKELHKVTIKPSDAKLGSVSLTPHYDNFYQEICEEGSNGKPGKMIQIESWYTPGTEVTAKAEAAANYRLEYWKKDGDETQYKGDNLKFTIENQDETITAHFAIGHKGKVIFDYGGTRVNGEPEKAGYKNAVSLPLPEIKDVLSFTIPTNYTFFKSVDEQGKQNEKQYTLDHWVNKANPSQHPYEPGNTYSFEEENEVLTLVPVFKENPTTQDNRINKPVIRYDFSRKVKEYEDPTSGTTRKVCAPYVDIKKNQNIFWTTKAYTNVRKGGEDHPHWLDVALWCNTGKNGYIRNEDFDDWCAFGPGTTFWTAAGTGTQISILSYSKITSTTIDGVVPTLNRERTNLERQKAGLPTLEEEEQGKSVKAYMYVYSYTTINSDVRVPIIIGDDYSYYQWMEIEMQAANWVTLHTKIDNEAHGRLEQPELVITGEGHEISNMEDGGYAFHRGERIKLTFDRKKGYELDKIVNLDDLDEDGEPVAVLKKTENGYWSITEDNKDVFTVTTSENYPDKRNAYWAEDNIRTKYEVEFDITAHHNLQVCFKEKDKTYHITYNAGDYASGTSPEATWVEEGDLFEIPRNTTLYYEGNTLAHWEDSKRDVYQIGERYPAKASNLRMFPVFEPNKFSLLHLNREATATWYFTQDDDAPTINYQKTSGFLVTQLKMTAAEMEETAWIDVKIDLDATKGKFDNTTDRTERIQINEGSVIAFTATKKCKAVLQTTESNKKVKIAGEEKTLVNNQAEVVWKGETSEQKVEFLEEKTYSKSFSVTYFPQEEGTLAEISSLTCNGKVYENKQQIEEEIGKNGYLTLYASPWENDEKMPVITGTATLDGTVEATEATVLTKECVVTVKNKNGVTVETYPVKFEFDGKPKDYPLCESITINGKTYNETTISLDNVAKSGVISFKFNRTMEAAGSSTQAGKEQLIKYWDQPAGETIKIEFKPEDGIFKDIYGMTCQKPISITLNITKVENSYEYHKFDFIVGAEGYGDMDEAIRAANGKAEGMSYNNTKADGQRYYIFVPDGDYQLTGNTTISCSTDPKDAPKDEKGEPKTDMNGQNNGMTEIVKSNISLIGQSKEGVRIWNHPIVEGIGYTATINLPKLEGKTIEDFYVQDLTLENKFDYWGSMSGQDASGAGRAVVFCDRGNRTVMKNVSLLSWQDTYYSDNSNDNYRGYFEGCDLAGVVDWICGNGDIWFERCNLIHRDRTGNNITAPSTEVGQEWGYVFNNCNIKVENEDPLKFKDQNWTLARPWNNSPACTFINTKMYTQPRKYGWTKMTAGLKLRFHEFKSMDGYGNPIPLETRSLAACTPAPSSDDCILTDTTGYNIRNVMSGTDAFDPQILCRQIDAQSGLQSNKSSEEEVEKEKAEPKNHIVWEDKITINDNLLQWETMPEALCYFLFKKNEETGKWIYKENTIENQINLNDYGNGYYCIRAANQRGGLGAATKEMLYVITDPYKLDIKKVGEFKENGVDYGWSTICLPFNAKVPEEVTAYAATAHGTSDSTSLIKDLIMTLTPVEVINAGKGYVVYGPVGKHSFHPTSMESSNATILKGNPTSTDIPVENNKGYVLSYKSTWGIGFYKYAGSTLAAYRAWLPKEMVTSSNQDNLALGKQNIHFVFAKGEDTAIHNPITYQNDSEDDKYYNLSGQRVEMPSKPGIYISKKKGKMIIR